MKVKNEYVQIKIGDKVITHKNMILNEYLEKIFNSQIDTIHNNCYIDICYLKFDEPLNVNYDSEIYYNQFDLEIYNYLSEENFKKRARINKNNVIMNYVFDSSCQYRIGDMNYTSDILKEFVNRKIVGIGFGINNHSKPIFSYLDTSNMNLIINRDEMITISRVDVFQSDGIINGYELPLHLVNDLAFKDCIEISTSTHFSQECTKAQLYSVGFGSYQGIMDEEYLINNVSIDRNYNSITFNIDRDKNIGIYPSNNLNTGFIPLKDNSKYLIFKYRLYRIDSWENKITYLDKYYTMSMLNDNFGDLDIKLKIERL